MRYAQIVMGPAGCGKSTYCSTLVKYGKSTNRQIDVVNLDPAAEQYDYETLADIRDLIRVDDTMGVDSLGCGPNGGLVYCMEYFLANLHWLEEQLQEVEDDYIIFDCPGQIELYVHYGIMRTFVETLQKWNFNVCGVFILDSQFLIDTSKFFSGTLAALSCMTNLEVSHVNVMTKMDLLSKKARKTLSRYFNPDLNSLLQDETCTTRWSMMYQRLTDKLVQMMDDYSLVKYIPLNRNDEDSIQNLLIQIDHCLQYGEDLDVRSKDFEERDSVEDD